MVAFPRPWRTACAAPGPTGVRGLAVADDSTVADTLLRLAAECDARAPVLGTHAHARISEVLFGTTTRKVMVREKPG